jgi:hypothetical protein
MVVMVVMLSSILSACNTQAARESGNKSVNYADVKLVKDTGVQPANEAGVQPAKEAGAQNNQRQPIQFEVNPIPVAPPAGCIEGRKRGLPC